LGSTVLVFLSLVATCHGGAYYYMYATTWDATHAGSDSDIYMRVHGMKGSTSWFECDLSGTDDFTRGDTDYYRFYRSEDVGDILCVEFHTAGSDALLVYKVRIASSSSGWKTIYNKNRVWLSRDSDEGITQSKWCLNDCALDLPIHSSFWLLAKTDFDMSTAKVNELAPTILDSHTMDATNSTMDMETEYFASGTASDSMTFSITGGVVVSRSALFNANPITVVNSKAELDTSQTLQFQHSVPLKESETQSSWYGCRAPKGKKVKCSAVMDKTQVKVSYTQTWQSKRNAACTWAIAGQFSRIWDSKLEQRIEEL